MNIAMLLARAGNGRSPLLDVTIGSNQNRKNDERHRLPRRHAQRGLIVAFIAFAMLATSVFGGLGPHAAASQKPAYEPAPILGHMPDAAHPDSFSVAGAYFTPSGKVYLAIYDQAGQALYENRWVRATAKLNADQAGRLNDHGVIDAVASPGGAIHETFDHLCGAKAMIRALDAATSRWSNWVAIEPACPSNAAAIAGNFNATLKLPVAREPSAFEISIGQFVAIAPPLLLKAPSTGDAPDVVTVSGLGFTAGQRVYIAVYDTMGAKLYVNRWLTADSVSTVVGSSAASSQTPNVAKTADGEFHVSFANLCGANVMIRAYDMTTETWSNWIDANKTCSSDPPTPTLPNGQPAKN